MAGAGELTISQDDARWALELLAAPMWDGDDDSPPWVPIAEIRHLDNQIDCCVRITFNDVARAQAILRGSTR